MDYSFMNKSFTCTGTSCLGVIDTTENENKIYIRCQDSKGNSNSQSKEYTLYRPQDALKIESLKPLKSYTTETSLTFNLELRVSGGSGDEVCSFKIQGYNEDYTEFLTHKGDYHIQELTLPLGVRNTFIRCVDSSNDAAVFTERISINQDINSPLISRAYGMGNSLVLKTTEKAECKYVLSDCNKKFEAMQSFTGNGLKHQATGRKGNIY